MRLPLSFAIALAFLAAPSVTQAVAPGEVPPGADPVVARWPVWPYPAACFGPPFDPVRVFSEPATAELGSRPAEVALRDALQNPALADVGMTGSGWRRISESEMEGVFARGALPSRLSPFSLWWARFVKVGEEWRWMGSGTCTPRTILHGLPAVTWTLVPDQRAPEEDTRRIRIVLGAGGGCSGGVSATERARKPIFRQIGRRLLMTILVEPMPPGAYTCQGTFEPPFFVKLPGRLGSRRLFDGSTYPPGDVVSAWGEQHARNRSAARAR